MRSAIDGVDVVGEAEDRLGVCVVVLQRNLHDDVALLGLHVDGLLVQHLLALVEQLDELGDAAGVLVDLRLGLALGVGLALIGERDLDALVQERELAKTVGEGVEVVLGDREDALVGKEVDLGAAALGRAHLAEFRDGVALGVVHLPGKAVAPDLDLERFTQRVDAGDTDAVQAARDLVVGGVELTASMQHREHHLHRGHGLAGGQGLVVDRNAATVVDDRNGVVDMDGDIDARGIAGQRLVDRVVDDLIDQVMQTHFAGRADVHGGAQADRSEAFEDRDIFRGVASGLGWSRRCGGRRWGLTGGCGRGSFFRHERDTPMGSGWGQKNLQNP